jgi:hypothetical protein
LIQASVGEHIGQRNLAVTANTYTHVLADEGELDYERLLGCQEPVHAYVHASDVKKNERV